MSKLIIFKDISKSFFPGGKEINVLKGINLEINEGSFVSIMGQSGSGKSTLMNIIGMLDTPTKGEYYFDNKNVSYLTDDEQSLIRRQNIGFIFQSYNLLPKVKVLKQVMTPLMYQGIPNYKRKELALKALGKVGLSHRLNSLPTQLSGGEQQRVSIARAIVTEPKLILGDEPTGALDTKTGKEIMDLIVNLNKEGKTIVLITHEKNIDAYAKIHIGIKDGVINI